jgi:hypothetical protein
MRRNDHSLQQWSQFTHRLVTLSKLSICTSGPSNSANRLSFVDKSLLMKRLYFSFSMRFPKFWRSGNLWYRWSVESVHTKNIVSILHLLVALARHFRYTQIIIRELIIFKKLNIYREIKKIIVKGEYAFVRKRSLFCIASWAKSTTSFR